MEGVRKYMLWATAQKLARLSTDTLGISAPSEAYEFFTEDCLDCDEDADVYAKHAAEVADTIELPPVLVDKVRQVIAQQKAAVLENAHMQKLIGAVRKDVYASMLEKSGKFGKKLVEAMVDAMEDDMFSADIEMEEIAKDVSDVGAAEMKEVLDEIQSLADKYTEEVRVAVENDPETRPAKKAKARPN